MDGFKFFLSKFDFVQKPKLNPKSSLILGTKTTTSTKIRFELTVQFSCQIFILQKLYTNSI